MVWGLGIEGGGSRVQGLGLMDSGCRVKRFRV